MVLVILFIVLVAAISGLVYFVRNDTDLDVSDNGSSGTPTPTPTPSNTDKNNADMDVNVEFYQNAALHAFSVDDLIRTDRIGEPVVSPDEQWTAFTRYVYKCVALRAVGRAGA